MLETAGEVLGGCGSGSTPDSSTGYSVIYRHVGEIGGRQTPDEMNITPHSRNEPLSVLIFVLDSVLGITYYHTGGVKWHQLRLQ